MSISARYYILKIESVLTENNLPTFRQPNYLVRFNTILCFGINSYGTEVTNVSFFKCFMLSHLLESRHVAVCGNKMHMLRLHCRKLNNFSPSAKYNNKTFSNTLWHFNFLCFLMLWNSWINTVKCIRSATGASPMRASSLSAHCRGPAVVGPTAGMQTGIPGAVG